MSPLVLTDDQQNAYEDFVAFLTNPNQDQFVLKGYAGTGKTTLVRHLLARLPEINKTLQLLNPDALDLDLKLTATTHKAAEALSEAVDAEVKTIHSELRMIVQFDPTTRQNKLVPQKGQDLYTLNDCLILIDEASYIGNRLLTWIRKRTKNCKIVYIGDPAQLLDVGSLYSPVFNAGLPQTEMKKIVRQAEGSPIIELASQFREVLDTGKFPKLKLDGKVVRHIPEVQFEREILQEFTKPHWHYTDSKVLTWTNKAAINYNQAITEKVSGTREFQTGDYVIMNGHLSSPHGQLKNESTVKITSCKQSFLHDIPGYDMILNNHIPVFVPKEYMTEIKVMNHLHKLYPGLKEKDITEIYMADFLNKMADLRATYSCTINKSQGSTYGHVYIDLNDLKRCTHGSQIARLLYVAVSRAQHGVTFTGDLV